MFLFTVTPITLGPAIFNQEIASRQDMVFLVPKISVCLWRSQSVLVFPGQSEPPKDMLSQLCVCVCGLSQMAELLLAELAGVLLNQSFKTMASSTE